MRARVVVGVLVAAVLFYMGLTVLTGIWLLTQDEWTLKLFGVAVLVVVPIGGWLIFQEIQFGRATQRLGRQMPEGTLDVGADLPRRPSGRVDRSAADEVFDQYRLTVQANPNDWRAWYRLGEAYELARDRRRARESMRTAIALFDAGRTA